MHISCFSAHWNLQQHSIQILNDESSENTQLDFPSFLQGSAKNRHLDALQKCCLVALVWFFFHRRDLHQWCRVNQGMVCEFIGSIIIFLCWWQHSQLYVYGLQYKNQHVEAPSQCWRVDAQTFLKISQHQETQCKLLTPNRMHTNPLLIAQRANNLLRTCFKTHWLVFAHKDSLSNLKYFTCYPHAWSWYQKRAPCTYLFWLELG